jgi:putative transposase
MPSINSIKNYAPYSFYHVYNRGVEKRAIFHDDQDYAAFTKLLRKYLDPSYTASPGEIRRPSYAQSIQLLAYCLMPNHFHLLLYQLDDEKALEKLFRSLMTGYVMYFNQKYRRSGPLFQGRYKASLINSDSYLQHISRYIHLNPLDSKLPYKTYPYSSYSMYLNSSDQLFVKTKPILNLFNQQGYIDFVDEYADLFTKRPKDNNLAFTPSGLS